MAQSLNTNGRSSVARRLAPLASVLSLAFSVSAHAALLWDNGSLVNQPGAGAGGADVSSILPGNSYFGWSVSTNSGWRLADDFTVAPGQTWALSGAEVFGYQTNSTTTSTFTSLTLRIWQGAPGVPGSTLVWDGSAGEQSLISGFTGIYRTTETIFSNTQRPIMSLSDGVGGTVLGAGTYWLDWTATGSLGSGPFSPPLPVTSGNGLQFDASSGVWGALTDYTGTGVEFAFRIHGTDLGGAVPEPSTYGLLGAMVLLGFAEWRRRASRR
jgi:hypothetical protein